MASEASESPRFITGNSLVRDLCIRERDFVQKNRLLYKSVLRDAFLLLNLRTVMLTRRVVIEIPKGQHWFYTPQNYLGFQSIAAEDEHGRLAPMVIYKNVKTDIADLSLTKKCGCDCGCDHDYCNDVRNYETIFGTVTAKMPDATFKTFNTSFRKILQADGTYVEETIQPVEVFQNNVHTATELRTTTNTLCKLTIKKCGCVEHTHENRENIERFCWAVNVAFESGSACILAAKENSAIFNVDEQGDKIFIPPHFHYRRIVLRYYHNSKTKDLMIPYLAKEVMMSGIKKITTEYDPDAPERLKMSWNVKHERDMQQFMENLMPVKLDSFLSAVIGRDKVMPTIQELILRSDFRKPLY